MKKDKKEFKNLKKIPEAELDVMQAVWACKGDITRRKIEDVLLREHPMATTTLLTFLTRLCERGYLSVRKVGRMSVYEPLVSRKQYLAQQADLFVGKLCGGSMQTFAGSLLDSGLSKDQIKELRKLLKEKGE